MEKIVVPIKGMHCNSCVILIEDEIKKIPGVTKVNASYKKKRAEIYSKFQIATNRIEEALRSSGNYSIGEDEEKFWLSEDASVYKHLTISIILIAILYFIARATGFANINIASQSKSVWLALLVGLTAGFSSCMALVGGLVLGISSKFAEKHPNSTALQKFKPHVFFNIGRIASYFILGGMIGIIGKAFQLSGQSLGVITMFVAFIMLILGFQLTELFPKISKISITLPRFISRIFGSKSHENEYSHANSMVAGALTFFLPCGFTQAMQLFAMSTGSFISGALIMGLFAIGTAPGLLGVGGLTSIIKGKFSKAFFRFVGTALIFMAFFNLTNGWNLTGWSFPAFSANSNQVSENSTSVTIENGFQIVKMTQSTFGYEPNNFVIKKGIPVKWVIDSTNIATCASSIYAPAIGVRQFLEEGENVITFTPKNSGAIKFSCSMGMYTGRFTVVE